MGGGTSSTPVIPEQFLPLINASVGQEVLQQGLLPISSFNNANPMGVQGLTQGQQYGMGMVAGAGQQSPLGALALQAAQRAAGMSGAGPLSGSYDPSGEMGLQDWMQLTNPYFGQGGEMGAQVPMQTAMQSAIGANVSPQPNPNPYGLGGPMPGGYGAMPTNGVTAAGNVHGNKDPYAGYLNPAGRQTATATGPQWQTTQDGAFSGQVAHSMTPEQRRALQPYMDVMATPALARRIAGDPSTWTQFQAGQNGMPTYNGFQFTGAQHERGGNDAIAQHFLENGATPAQLAQFLLQGSAAQARVGQGTNSAQLTQQGRDRFGNDISGSLAAAQTFGQTHDRQGRLLNRPASGATPSPAPTTIQGPQRA